MADGILMYEEGLLILSFINDDGDDGLMSPVSYASDDLAPMQEASRFDIQEI